MDLKPLLCPQCGGEIDNYTTGQTTATCNYCGMRFVVEQKQDVAPEEPVPIYTEIDDADPVNSNKLVTVFVVAALFIIGAVTIGGLMSTKSSRSAVTDPPKRSTPTPARGISPAVGEQPNLLEFGGKGTGNGLFKDANSVAVDKQGRIYVSDDSLRVQQFDANGQFLRSIIVPQKTAQYEHARTIDKIAAGDDGRLYVAVGGVLLVYADNGTAPAKTIHFVPDYVQDFALRSDGGLLVITSNDDIETLRFLSRNGQANKRIVGFHTKAADAALSPRGTGIAAIRLAVDGAGNIFSVYAFGSLGSYTLSYNAEELTILRFAPDGKYVNKFVQTMNSCGIEVDNQGRIYISEGSNINIYKNNGDLAKSVAGDGRITSFALDRANNIYFLRDDKVVKRAAVP